jgi:hypothetical protein
MEPLLGACWHGISKCTHAVTGLLRPPSPTGSAPQEYLEAAAADSDFARLLAVAMRPQQQSYASSNPRTVLPVLRAEQTVQCCCLSALVWMLVQFLQTTDTAPAPSSATGARNSSSDSNAAAPAGSSSQGTQRPVDNPNTYNLWLRRVLVHAPSLPAAYASMLEQLGCSREVGL